MTRESVVQRRFIKSFLLLIPNDSAIISTVAQRHKKDYDFFKAIFTHIILLQQVSFNNYKKPT